MRLLAKLEGNNACSMYRIVQPFKALRQRNHQADWCVHISQADYMAADMVVVQRPQEASTWPKIYGAKRKGKKILLEFDDNQLDIPEWNPAYKFFENRKHLLPLYMELADGVTVSTNPLKAAYSKFHDNIVVLPNSIDFEDPLDCDIIVSIARPVSSHWDSDAGQYRVERESMTLDDYFRYRAGRIAIGWGGSISHLKDLRLMTEDLLRLMVERDDFVLVWMGAAEDGMIGRGLHDRQFMVSGVTPYQYRTLMKYLKLDIGLAPVVDISFNHSKSNLKAIEYLSLGVVPVVSDLVTYHGTFEQGTHGLYVKENNGGWFEALKTLLDNPDQIQIMAEAGQKHVREHYDQAKNIAQWEKFYQSIIG